MYHVSRVTCHMSHVTRQNIYLYFLSLKIIGQSGGAGCRRFCNQQGLPRLVYKEKCQLTFHESNIKSTFEVTLKHTLSTFTYIELGFVLVVPIYRNY